ncbi:MAG: hypothetical protein HOD64_01750 [Candidatus Cloacimonetes bacterium]|nr:hypothetical protein [Candidatus Cloacimonadota bacterium]MBT4331975.1 hypothetical protein [Candidatus Cloacimonadota bacterium]MBT4575096.1 hypothetical protein [Candidatus Cloacimonadota bacterium]
MKNDTLLHLLRDLGLNELEANIYIWLLENKRSTGYKIAGQISKPVANTYKALKSLQQKGAVISDDSSGTIYFDTIPIEEFLNKIENEFKTKREQIVNEVNKLEVQQEPTGIYEIKSKDLVFEKAANMIRSTENSILIDGFPAPMKTIKKYLSADRSKDINIYVKNYSGDDIDNVHQLKANFKDLPISELNGQWLIVLRDTAESLIAFFSKDGKELIHSIWTQDPFISFILFNGSAYEFNFTEVCEQVYSNESNKVENMKSIIERYKNIYRYMRVEEKKYY